MANWIKGAIKHPGALRRQLGVPQGQKIPAAKMAAAKKRAKATGNTTLLRRIALARTLGKMHR